MGFRRKFTEYRSVETLWTTHTLISCAFDYATRERRLCIIWIGCVFQMPQAHTHTHPLFRLFVVGWKDNGMWEKTLACNYFPLGKSYWEKSLGFNYRTVFSTLGKTSTNIQQHCQRSFCERFVVVWRCDPRDASAQHKKIVKKALAPTKHAARSTGSEAHIVPIRSQNKYAFGGRGTNEKRKRQLRFSQRN